MKKYFKMSGFVLLYMAVYFILQNQIGSLYAVFYIIKEMLQDPKGFLENSNAFMNTFIEKSVWFVIISAAISFPAYIFIMWLRKERLLRFCRFSKISLSDIALVSIMGVTLHFVAVYLVTVTGLDKLSPDTEKLFGIIFEGNSFGVILIAVGIIAPIIEEIIFRGLVFTELRRSLPITPSLLIQAFLFGVFHMNLTQGVYAFFLGIVLGLVIIWVKSIWAPIFIHIFFNSTSVALSKFADEQLFNTYQYPILIFSTILLIAVYILIWKKRKIEPAV